MPFPGSSRLQGSSPGAWQTAVTCEGLELGPPGCIKRSASANLATVFLAGAGWAAVLGGLFCGGTGGRKGSSLLCSPDSSSFPLAGLPEFLKTLLGGVGSLPILMGRGP